MNFENDLIFSVTQFTNSFRDTLDKHLSEIELYGGQVYILIFLWEQNGQTQIALARKLNLSPPTIHKMVKSLSKNDFVESRKCGDDARQTRVYLTKKGVDIRLFVEQQWEKVEEKVFAPLTETEKLIYGQILNKLNENLNGRG